MNGNKLRRLWREGKTALNAWLTIPSPWVAELMAHTGFDSLTVDLQHGLADYQTLVSMLQAMSATGVVPLVRASWNEPGPLMRLLDAGAYGVIAPMIDNERDVRAFVGACRYPPVGYRSYGPIRASLGGDDDYAVRADNTIVTLGMIETKEALGNLERILEVEGLDGVYVGTIDLSLSLGITDLGNLNDRRLGEALDKILAATSKRKLVAGVHAQTPATVGILSSRGFQLITPANDTKLLRSAAEMVHDQARKELNEKDPPLDVARNLEI